MLLPVLGDPGRFPAEEIIFKYIGNNKSFWLSLFKTIDGTYPEFNSKWKYCKDGKSWLLKVARKSKTIFWLSVINGSCRSIFYFTEKAREAINNRSLSNDLKEQFNQKSGPRCITVAFRTPEDVEYAKELIAIKLGVK